MLAERLTAQLLAGRPARDPVAVAERLLAIQAQDPRGARLAIRARTSGLSAADVDRALTEERSLVVTWLNRGTLHLVRSEDYAWLHALTTPPLFAGNARRLAQEGVSPRVAEKGVATIERSLAADGALTRSDLRDRLDRVGVPTKGQALVHVLMLASLRGLIVRGPMVGRQHAYALVRDWLGPQPRLDRDRALAELARRYLAGHGPATERDLAKWAGLPLRDARKGLAAITGVRPRRAPLPPPRLLGAFEPLLLGWAARDWLQDADRAVSGGMFRPIALAEGKVVATWSLCDGRVVLEPFQRLHSEVARALAADADAAVRFLIP
ncbi:MAG TPA: winged helix DNA-binding domain-containing protein [Gaiellaceae bacterium]